MKYIMMWLITVITSFGMELGSELRYFKDAADLGYKVDVLKFNQITQSMSVKRPSMIKFLIPIYNLMMALQNTTQYDNLRQTFFNQMQVFGCLEEMSDEEKKEYLKNPTGIKVLAIMIKSQVLKKEHKNEKKVETESIEIKNEANEKTELQTLSHNDRVKEELLNLKRNLEEYIESENTNINDEEEKIKKLVKTNKKNNE